MEVGEHKVDVRLVSPRSHGSTNSHSETDLNVAILAAGRGAERRASALRDWLANRCDDIRPWLVLLGEEGCRDAHNAAATVDSIVREALLVVVVMEEGKPWDMLLGDTEDLFTEVPSKHLIVVRPERPGKLLVSELDATTCRAGLTVPQEASGFAAVDATVDYLLPGVPEAIMGAAFNPGMICTDLADYFTLLGEGPVIAGAGFGCGSGHGRVEAAADMALTQLMDNALPTREPRAVMCILGLPLDGTIPEFEGACERFRAAVGGKHDPETLCASPIVCSVSGWLTYAVISLTELDE
jgi:hypothetical protein